MASGPSMREADAELICEWRDGHSRRAVAINSTFLLAPWADAIYAYDPQWWSDNVADAQKTDAELWSASAEACRLFGLNRARLLMSGGNSGYQGTRWALTHCQADPVILVGFDMDDSGPKEHWHDPHPARYNRSGDYRKWRYFMKLLTQRFPGRLLNASRETAIPGSDIPRVRLENALC